MRVRELVPFGAVVEDLAVGPLDAGLAGELSRLLAAHGVLVLPGQYVDDVAFRAFLASFGPLAFTQGETPVPGHPDLNVVSNVGRTTPPRSTFHVDTSYVSRPPAYTALRAVQVPARGGQTVFSDQYTAAATLEPALRRTLQGRRIRHVVTGVELPDGAESAAEHPILRAHPVSGRTALYLTTPARCAAIPGIDDVRAQELIAAIFAHSIRPENLLAHAWSPGDVVIWDNGAVLHRADHSGVSGDRVMHRGMVASYPSTAAASAGD